MIRLFDDSTLVLRLIIATSGRRLHEIAQHCKVSPATISNVANGVTAPSDSLKTKLADLFGIEADRLFRKLKDELPWAFSQGAD